MYEAYFEAREAVFDAICKKGKKCGDICIPKKSDCRKSGATKSPSGTSRRNTAIVAATGISLLGGAATAIALSKRGGSSKESPRDQAKAEKEKAAKYAAKQEKKSMNRLEMIAEKARLQKDVEFWEQNIRDMEEKKPVKTVGLSDEERLSRQSKIKTGLVVSRASEDPDSDIEFLPSRGKTRGRKPKNPVSPGVPVGGRRSVVKSAFTDNRNKKPKPAPIKTQSSEWVEPTAIATVATNQAALNVQAKKKKNFWEL